MCADEVENTVAACKCEPSRLGGLLKKDERREFAAAVGPVHVVAQQGEEEGLHAREGETEFVFEEEEQFLQGVHSHDIVSLLEFGGESSPERRPCGIVGEPYGDRSPFGVAPDIERPVGFGHLGRDEKHPREARPLGSAGLFVVPDSGEHITGEGGFA